MGPSGLAMKEGIAVVLMGGIYVFELSGGDYVARNVANVGEGLGSDIDISNRRILLGAGDCAWNGSILEWSTANNRWQGVTTLPGESKDGCDDEFHGGPVEISGDLAWVRGGGVFQRTGGTTWISVPQWTKPTDSYAAVALNGTNAFVSGSGRYGTYVNNRDASGVWTTQDYLRTVDNMPAALESPSGMLERNIAATATKLTTPPESSERPITMDSGIPSSSAPSAIAVPLPESSLSRGCLSERFRCRAPRCASNQFAPV